MLLFSILSIYIEIKKQDQCLELLCTFSGLSFHLTFSLSLSLLHSETHYLLMGAGYVMESVS